MATRFTNGKWERTTVSPYLPPNITCGKKIICTFIDSNVSLAQKEANAKLIAAAPEMLDALMAAKILIEDMDRLYSDQYELITQAIKKATE